MVHCADRWNPFIHDIIIFFQWSWTLHQKQNVNLLFGYSAFSYFEFQTNLEVCKNLTVLYLYDNKIRSIKNLSSMANLTHLYLQTNHISRITGLNGLSRLQKLYVNSFASFVIIQKAISTNSFILAFFVMQFYC